MTSQAAAVAEEQPQVTEIPKKKKSSGNALTKLKQRAQEDHNGKGGQLRRRRMRFTVDKDICDPGAFDDDFDLVVVSASTQVEMDALKACVDNPFGVIAEMVKRCIVSCDGEPVLDGDGSRDTLWEALGTGGRALLTRKWNEFCGGTSAEAIKKAETSTLLLV